MRDGAVVGGIDISGGSSWAIACDKDFTNGSATSSPPLVPAPAKEGSSTTSSRVMVCLLSLLGNITYLGGAIIGIENGFNGRYP